MISIPLMFGWLLDRWLGDPEKWPHPVVWFGRVIGALEGCVSGSCMGTYIHGILDNPQFIDWMLNCTEKQNLEPSAQSRESFKEEQYDRLADHVRKYVDVETIIRIAKNS